MTRHKTVIGPYVTLAIRGLLFLPILGTILRSHTLVPMLALTKMQMIG